MSKLVSIFFAGTIHLSIFENIFKHQKKCEHYFELNMTHHDAPLSNDAIDDVIILKFSLSKQKSAEIR